MSQKLSGQKRSVKIPPSMTPRRSIRKVSTLRAHIFRTVYQNKRATTLTSSASRNGEFSQLWELLGADREKNYGEFPIEIMGNFDSSGFYSKFLSKLGKSVKNALFSVFFFEIFCLVYSQYLEKHKWSCPRISFFFKVYQKILRLMDINGLIQNIC